MTYEEAINVIKHGCIYRDKRGGEALTVAIEALEKQILYEKEAKVFKDRDETISCEDCIHNGVCYTQETSNDIEEQIKEFGCDDFKDKSKYKKTVRGEWKENSSGLFYCSHCNEGAIVEEITDFDYDYDENLYECGSHPESILTDFCPNCGADMRIDKIKED